MVMLNNFLGQANGKPSLSEFLIALLTFAAPCVAYADIEQSGVSDGPYFLATGLLLLLAVLFFFVFNWMQRLEKTSYMGRIYADMVQDLEYNRRKARLERKRAEGEFDRQAMHKLRHKYQQVMESKPPWPQVLDQYRVRANSESDRPGGGQAGVTTLSDDAGIYADRRNAWEDAPEIYLDLSGAPKEHKDLATKYWAENRAYEDARRKLRLERHNLEIQLYDAELDGVSNDAKRAAKREADIDVGAFRGRGPTFVLQFTAVVVIVFLAVLLGVVDVLDNQQIGTLLAAVAGYVLGRSADSAGSAPEARGVPEAGADTDFKEKDEESKQAHTPAG
jgi:hypothetical protein